MKMFLVEKFEEEVTPELNVMLLTGMNNLLTMPTQIILRDENGDEVGMSMYPNIV